ncbi:MAG: T9SS type A sorting domain-containing protein [Bacteroidetes bacterium]|nr:T9SS type A sorting domain-containing protein [Bacteroidota bacterium]MBS1628459.1 T9SS type A sorting domain-containing protein [Bacteroidota bacterium]
MKRSIGLFSFCLLAQSLQAQTPITITANGYSFIGLDTVASIAHSATANYLGLPASNASWDLSNLMLESGLGSQTRLAPPAANNHFPQARYYVIGGLSINPLLLFNADMYMLADTTGFYSLGADHTQPSIQSITPFTRNSGDSLFFPIQTDTFSQPIQQMKFPATMNDSWGTAGSKLKVHFLVTASYFNLSNAPGDWMPSYDYAYRVVGWGQMRVPMAQGGNSVYMPVLQVQETLTRQDSFTINGAEPPSGFLTALSLSQGGLKQYFITRFLRPGQIIPLAEIYHLDNTFTTWTKIFVQQDGIVPDAVPTLHTTQAWKAYPNPLRGQQLHLFLPGNTSYQGHYRLFNMEGKLVESGALSFAATIQSAAIFFSKPLCPGFYSLQLATDEAMRSIPLLVD